MNWLPRTPSTHTPSRGLHARAADSPEPHREVRGDTSRIPDREEGTGRGRRSVQAGACALVVAVAALAFASRTSSAPAQTVQLRLSGHVGGAVRAVVAGATDAWIGQGVGVSRVDLADGESASIVEHVPLGAGADVHSLARRGAHLYVGARDGIHIVDVEAAGGPAVVAHHVTPGTIRALTVHETAADGPALLFMADDLAGVLLATIDGPRMSVTASVPSDGGARSAVAVTGSLALVPGDDLYVVSIAEPTSPVQVGRLSTRGQVRGVAAGAEGTNVAYVSDSAEGLLAVDLTDPSQPEVRGYLAGVPSGNLVRLDRVLYLVDRGVNLVEIAADDPTGLEYVGVYGDLSGSLAIGIAGGFLLSAAGDQLVVASFDRANPLYQPLIVAHLQSAWPVRQHVLLPDHVYLVRGENGLMAIRTADPTRPEVALEYRPPWGAYGLCALGDRLYVSTVRGFEVWDVADPASPSPVTAKPFADWSATSWIAAAGQRLVATTRERLHVADLSAGELPQEAAEMEYARQPGWPAEAVPQGIALNGPGVAYVPAGSAGVAVLTIDDRDPASIRPEVRAFVTVPAGIQALSALVSGSLLAVGTQDGVVLYDLADPLRPQPVAHHRAGYSAIGMAVSGTRLYVAADLSGLLVLDVADPRVPSLVGALRVDYPITGVVADATRVFAAGAGLLVLDASEPGEGTPLPPATAMRPTLPPVVPTVTARPTDLPPPTASATDAVTPPPTPSTTPSPSDVPTAIPTATSTQAPIPRLYVPWAERWPTD